MFDDEFYEKNDTFSMEEVYRQNYIDALAEIDRLRQEVKRLKETLAEKDVDTKEPPIYNE